MDSVQERMDALLEALKLRLAKTGTHYKGTAAKEPGKPRGAMDPEARAAHAAHYEKQERLAKAKERAKARETAQGRKHKFHIRQTLGSLRQKEREAKQAERAKAKPARKRRSYKAVRRR
jgi:hypothetical protein